MELDQLKKSWNALDKQLQKEPIVDEKQIAELIVKYREGARKSMKRITNWQRLSVGIGLAAIVILVLVLVIVPSMITDLMTQQKTTAMCVFVGLTLIFGMWWDLKTFCWSRDTKVDEMPIVTVMERINTLRRWIKYEIIAISIWMLIFLALDYWVMGYYKLSLLAQVVFLLSSTVVSALVIYFLYKKMIYNNLDSAKKNLEELKELKSDN